MILTVFRGTEAEMQALRDALAHTCSACNEGAWSNAASCDHGLLRLDQRRLDVLLGERRDRAHWLTDEFAGLAGPPWPSVPLCLGGDA